MACSISEPFSGTGAMMIPGGRSGVEKPPDGSHVNPIAENGSTGNNLATIEPLEGGEAVLAELARVVARPHPVAARRRA